MMIRSNSSAPADVGGRDVPDDEAVLTSCSQPAAPDHSFRDGFANGGAVRHAVGDVGSKDGRRVHAVQRRARRWGIYGAAGVVFVFSTADEHSRVMLQKRSAFAHEGGTWSCAGGALDLGETPIEGALREASEEVGAIPGAARVVGEYRFVPADRLDVHHGGRRGGRALRRLDQLRDRRRRLVHVRRGGRAPPARRVRVRLAHIVRAIIAG